MRHIVFLLFPMIVFVSCASKNNYTNEVFSTTLQCNDSIINIDMFWVENKRTPLTGGIVVEVSNAVSITGIRKYIFIQKGHRIILSSESEANICMLNLTPYSEDSIRISNINAPIFYVKSDSLMLYKKKGDKEKPKEEEEQNP